MDIRHTPPSGKEERQKEDSPAPFWKVKSLQEMTPEEWESLCDGCAQCCLVKVQYDDSDEVFYTDLACNLLNLETCRCMDYAHRSEKVTTCLTLTAEQVPELDWLPKTCAYRLISEGKDLEWWHPLVSGDPKTVHTAGISVCEKVIHEEDIDPDDLEDHVDKWKA